jgi:protein TonB
MFEDSTFESAGRIRTRSRRWMIAAFTFNASLLLAFVLVPLLYLEALPPQTILTGITVPSVPHVQVQPKPIVQPLHPTINVATDPFTAPRQIPPGIYIPKEREPEPLTNPSYAGTPGGMDDRPVFFPVEPRPRVVHQPQAGPVRVSPGVEEGYLIRKTIPTYPPIAIVTRTQGVVILAATISKSGTIENLRVVSGPPVLQQSALDAVNTWRYKPYVLDREPVEVETTVNVVFTLGR